jgi:hypothetical protein
VYIITSWIDMKPRTLIIIEVGTHDLANSRDSKVV